MVLIERHRSRIFLIFFIVEHNDTKNFFIVRYVHIFHAFSFSFFLAMFSILQLFYLFVIQSKLDLVIVQFVPGLIMEARCMILRMEVMIDHPFFYSIVKTFTNPETEYSDVIPIFVGHTIEPSLA
ncbi:hypothetical protein ANTQUA_LOCUS774 [Anthophora quadrimaculata]